MKSAILWTLNGGLGNQIFQYLASIYIQENLDIDYVQYTASDYIQQGYRALDLSRLASIKLSMHDSESLSPYLRLKRKLSRCVYSSTFAHNDWLPRWLTFAKAYLNEAQFADKYSNSLEKLSLFLEIHSSKVKTFCIEGYWQNPSLYINSLRRWHSLFQLSASYLPHEWKDISYLSIHVRRGDYLDPSGYEFFFSKFHPVQYLQHALQLVPTELQFLPVVVVTDDRSWAEHHMSLLLGDKTFFIYSSEDPLVDWSLLNNSSFSIICNSTFSFTAAMLNYRSSSQRYRVIMPQWITSQDSCISKGWDTLPGSIVI